MCPEAVATTDTVTHKHAHIARHINRSVLTHILHVFMQSHCIHRPLSSLHTLTYTHGTYTPTYGHGGFQSAPLQHCPRSGQCGHLSSSTWSVVHFQKN